MNSRTSGKLKSIIDRSYLLEDVPKAHIYVESGQKIGNLVIVVLARSIPATLAKNKGLLSVVLAVILVST